MKIKWPEKLVERPVRGLKDNYMKGYNAALEACQKAFEEAKGEGLVELDADKIWKEFEQFLEPHTCGLMIKPQYARNANLIQNWFKRICEKYGTPKPRPVVTVDLISKVLFALYEVTGEVYLGNITSTAQAIFKHLEGK